MRIIRRWPDPVTGEIHDDSEDLGPGEYHRAPGRVAIVVDRVGHMDPKSRENLKGVTKIHVRSDRDFRTFTLKS